MESESDEKKIVIQLSEYEAKQLETGLTYLIEQHVKPGTMNNVPPDKLKAISWLIVFNVNGIRPKIGVNKVHFR